MRGMSHVFWNAVTACCVIASKVPSTLPVSKWRSARRCSSWRTSSPVEPRPSPAGGAGIGLPVVVVVGGSVVDVVVVLDVVVVASKLASLAVLEVHAAKTAADRAANANGWRRRGSVRTTAVPTPQYGEPLRLGANPYDSSP